MNAWLLSATFIPCSFLLLAGGITTNNLLSAALEIYSGAGGMGTTFLESIHWIQLLQILNTFTTNAMDLCKCDCYDECIRF
jgi:hypothetical protein